MKPIERYLEYKDEDLDRILILIRNGTIKSGKFSHLIKTKSKDTKSIMKEKELFKHAKNNI